MFAQPLPTTQTTLSTWPAPAVRFGRAGRPRFQGGMILRAAVLAAALFGAAPLLAAGEAASSKSAEAATTAQTLLVIEPTPEQPRNSEGDLIELPDGRLALVYTRFTGGDRDHSEAELALRTSADGGRTWSADRVIVPNEGGRNVMSVSLLRGASREILLFYLRKDSQGVTCSLFVRRSADGLQTLSDPVRVTTLDGYHVVNNARVVRLSSGRIIVPAALHTGYEEGATTPSRYSRAAVPLVYFSDDDGRTWRRDRTPLTPRPESGPHFQEPGVVELRDGRLWMYMRTNKGAQYGCWSSDGGESWTEPEPTALASPLSPATIQRVPWSGHLMAVWNDHSGRHPYVKGKRTPLAVALSRDDGRTWEPSRLIENAPDGWYCYTSILFQQGRAVLSYCAGDSRVGGLNRLKVTALPREWIGE